MIERERNGDGLDAIRRVNDDDSDVIKRAYTINVSVIQGDLRGPGYYSRGTLAISLVKSNAVHSQQQSESGTKKNLMEQCERHLRPAL